MLPRSLLSCRPVNGAVVPDYLGPHDYPWLRALLDEYARFAGKPSRELAKRLREPLTPDAPSSRKQRAARVLDRLCRSRGRPALPPPQVRAALFKAAAERPDAARAVTCLAVADKLEVDVATLEECMFADLPSERRIAAAPRDLDPVTLALEANLAFAQGLLRRATEVRLELFGNARSVVRLARLRGLICVVERPAGDSSADAVLSASGPLALFRRTIVYGRALASLIPGLTWCEHFRLQAKCLLDDSLIPIDIRSGDPIFPAAEPRRFDSKLERRFAREFAKAAPDWEIIREPEPLEAEGRLIFPDFALVHRRATLCRWLLEIVGYWTDEYIRDKLAALRAAQVENLIVCIDAERNCGDDELPAHAALVQFRRRIDPKDVLRIIEPEQISRAAGSGYTEEKAAL